MTQPLFGIIPPMTTPFDSEGEINHQALRVQVDWLIAQGSHGLAAGGSTGEGHTIDPDEFRGLMASTVEATAGRIPVVAGIIVDSTRDAVRRGKAVADLGVAALQVTPVHYLFRPTDDAMVDHFKAMADSIGLPILIYNVVPWTYLSPTLLCRIMEEVPLVVGVKQSAGDMKLLADLLLQAPEDKLIFTAVDALLYPSFTLGSKGGIAAILAAAPKACIDLWDAVQKGDHKTGLKLHVGLLNLWNAMFSDNLPACTKYAQTLQGCPGMLPRAPMPEPSDAQKTAIKVALKELGVDISKS